MADFQCIECAKATRKYPTIQVQAERLPGIRGVELRGLVRCTFDGYEWPVRLIDNVLYPDQPSLSRESTKLNGVVPEGLRQDIEEAEKAQLLNLNKATVVLCRRGIQLALEDLLQKVPNFPQKPTLGSLLVLDKQQAKPRLSMRTASLVEGIKDYGDGGAHRRENVDPEAARAVIFISVQALNDLYPLPA